METKRQLFKRRIAKIVMMSSLFVFILSLTAFAGTTDNGIPDGYKPAIYNGIAAQQFKDVFETETIEVSGIKVEADRYKDSVNDTIYFRGLNRNNKKME